MTRVAESRILTECLAGLASLVLLATLGVLLEGHASPLVAQGPTTPPATLRAYTHIFLAYAAVWLLLFGWVLRIAGKLKKASSDWP